MTVDADRSVARRTMIELAGGIGGTTAGSRFSLVNNETRMENPT
jgi:hypothetical protein